MDSLFVYRYRPGWLFAAVIGLVLLVVMFGALLVVDGFELRTFAMFGALASWSVIYGAQRSYQVTVDEDTISFRRVLTRRSRSMDDLTRVVPFTRELLLFSFGKRHEKVFRGQGADQLLDHIHQLKPSLTDPLQPPEFAIVFRGYDRTAVHDFIARGPESTNDASLAARTPPAFPIVWRGYARTQVDTHLGIPVNTAADQQSDPTT